MAPVHSLCDRANREDVPCHISALLPSFDIVFLYIMISGAGGGDDGGGVARA
jgi:hypothetical protein